MEIIRPISDLRNNFAKISREVKELNESVVLTKNGYGDMVVMSIEKYNELNFNNEIVNKLKEAENSSKNGKRYTHEEVFKELGDLIDG